jgi:hypothetical protein
MAHGLANDAFRVQVEESSNKMIDEVEDTWKNAVVELFDILPTKLLGRSGQKISMTDIKAEI